MKRTLLTAIFLLCPAAVIAQEVQVSPVLPETEPNSVEQPTGQKFSPIGMMMAQQLLQAQIVPLTDGGILIMFGGRLYKYDQNLNLTAQTDLQIDYDQLQTQLQEIMSRFPQWQQRLQSGGMDVLNGGRTNWQTDGAAVRSRARTQTKTYQK